jgi:hypothetical protein
MRFHGPIAAVLGFALLVSVAGCGSDNPAAPGGSVSHEEADDVATQSLLSVNLFGDELGAAVGSTSSAPLTRMSQTAWDTTFTTPAGLTYEASRTFYDAADNLLPDYGPTAVRMNWVSHASGFVATLRDSATVGHALVLDVRGIQPTTDTLRFDGVSTDTLLNRFRSLDGTRTRFYFWRSALTLADIRFLKSQIQAGTPRPTGVATMAIAVDRLRSYDRFDVASHFEVTAVFTFDGTDLAGILVDGRYAYRWNLVTGVVTRV